MQDGAGYNKVYEFSQSNSDPNYLKATFKVTFGEIYIHALYYSNSGTWTIKELLYDSSGETSVYKTVQLPRSEIYGGATNKGAFVLYRIRMRKWYLFNNYYQVMTYGWYYPPYTSGSGYKIISQESFRWNSSISGGLFTESRLSGTYIYGDIYGKSSGTFIEWSTPQVTILYNHVVWPETTSGYQV